jgi:N-formylglutamate amidohydrolase
MNIPVIIHVPHASASIPESEREKLALTAGDLRRELLRMTDWWTDELFEVGGESVTRLVFPVSRLVVDPERFADDTDEPMAARGMGAIYTRTSDGRPLRSPVDAEERQRLLQRYYVPHHEMLEQLVREALRTGGHCLVIDAHSFPSLSLPCDMDQSPDRPDICLGTDLFHTPEWLRRGASASFHRMGWNVELNRPHSGTIVPVSFYHQDRRVISVMVEINRALYMDERTGKRLPQFTEVSRNLQSALEALIACLRRASPSSLTSR